MSSYWPWWAGAIALGALTVGYWLLIRRPLGVSGLVGRLVELRAELALAGRDSGASDDEISRALDAATRDAFAEQAPDAGGAAPRAAAAGRPLGARVDLFGAAAFLLALAGGGLLSRLLPGGPTPGAGLGPEFARLFGAGWGAALALAGGGVLVGLGTTLAEGCSTGHGLTGSARLQPGSLLATASFLASAVAISLLAGWWAT